MSDNELLTQIAADVHAIMWMSAVALGAFLAGGLAVVLAIKEAVKNQIRIESEKENG